MKEKTKYIFVFIVIFSISISLSISIDILKQRVELLEKQQANVSIMQEYDDDFLNIMAEEPKEK